MSRAAWARRYRRWDDQRRASHDAGHRREPSAGDRVRHRPGDCSAKRARVFAHSYAPYDATEPCGADPCGIEGVLEALGGEGERLAHAEVDLADPAAPELLVQAAVERVGPLDALVLNHARSQVGSLDH